MTEVREFPTAAIASLSSGVMLCKFDEMHQAAEFLMGHPIWTHHFASEPLWEAMCKAVLEQCPGMPLKADASHVNKDNWQEFAAELEARFGKTVKIKRGGGDTAMHPLDGIPDDQPVIAVAL